MVSTGTETLEFRAEGRQLLRLMVNSVYSNKDVFLRELISNASDALDKVRLASFTDKELQVDVSDLHIEIDADRDERTLTVRDNGIGLSRDEVVELIGTIARSGTADLLQRMKESTDGAVAPELIGQFGVGFYASFMVADRVVLLTRRAGEQTGTRWASDGQGTYTVEQVDDAPQGTAVTLHLKAADPDDHVFDYTDPATIKQIVKRYSDFITWPVRTVVERTGADGATTTEVQTLNSMKALWARARDEVSEDEYHEFYKHVSHDWADPLEIIQLKAEGTFEYDALLFLPSHAPFDLFAPDGQRGVQLYVKRVFLMDNCPALMPGYLRFVTGVVDARDLSLNVSREILQQDRQVQLIRRRLVKKVLSTMRDLLSRDAERYQKFWTEFGAVVKEGLADDYDNRDAILGAALFASSSDTGRLTTLEEYVGRMKPGQRDIYYLTGESRSMIENSPHMELFRAKDYEVLMLTDPIDEMWVESVREFQGRPLLSIAKGEVDLDSDAERESAKDAREQQAREYGDLLSWMGEKLREDLREVRLSTRLTTSPARVVGDLHDPTPALARIYRAMGRDLPRTKRVLEVNPDHPMVAGLQEAHAKQPDSEDLSEVAELLYGLALLAEGGELSDPSRFARLMADRLARTI